MKKIIIFFLIVIFSGFLFNITNSATEGLVGASGNMSEFANSLSFTGDFDTSLRGIINIIMLLVNTLFFIFMIYAGILWLSSAGEEAKITTAKSIIVWCLVGMVVTFSSYAITAFIFSKLGVN